MVAYALIFFGTIAIIQKNYTQAYEIEVEAACTCREINAHEELGYAMAYQVFALRGLGRVVEARECLRETLHLALEIQASVTILWALQAASLQYLDQGKTERALELYALGINHPMMAKARLVEDLTGWEVDAAAAVLPAEVAEAARKRGRECGLFATAAELLQELNKCGN